MYEQNVIDLKKSWYILCFAWKWQGEKKIHTKALTDYRLKDPEDDSKLVADLWKVLDQAHVVIAHNGDKFDLRKASARFLKYGMRPPSPFKTIDTLKWARKHGFLSNKLNDLGAYLNIGRKLPHTGFDLWKRCMLLERKAMKVMKRYNARDVWLLEKIYERLRPYATNIPRTSDPDRPSCPACHSRRVKKDGFRLCVKRKVQQWQCLEETCGHYFS